MSVDDGVGAVLRLGSMPDPMSQNTATADCRIAASAAVLGALWISSTMDTAKARQPLKRGRLQDFSRQSKQEENRFDHIKPQTEKALIFSLAVV